MCRAARTARPHNPLPRKSFQPDCPKFEQFYEEGAHRRRKMVTSLHDRISGHAGRVRVLDRFLSYAKSKGDVWFARKDEIARYVLANRADTPIVDRGPPSATGLPGPTG